MSVFIREVTTIDEDYHFIFGYAFTSLFSKVSGDTPGVKRELVISHVINDHEVTTKEDLANFSSIVYVRQDPFKETVYILRTGLLFMLAQLVGALTLLNLLGFLATSFWTNRLYNASMIKHLYKVKHTSAGRDFTPAPMSKHSPSEENKGKEDPLGLKVED